MNALVSHVLTEERVLICLTDTNVTARQVLQVYRVSQ